MTTLIEAMARAIDPEVWSGTFLDVGSMNRARQESLERAQAALTAIQESGYVVLQKELAEEMEHAWLFQSARKAKAAQGEG